MDTPSLIPALLLLLLVTIYLPLYTLHLRRHHDREPPIIPSRLPYLGPLLGMAWHGGRHLKRLALANRHFPAFTLPLPFSRLYIVSDPVLAAAVQRASKSLSFTPLVPDITRQVLGLDQATVKVVREGVDEEKGFLAEMRNVVGSGLGPGPGGRLEELSRAAGRELGEEVEGYVRGKLGSSDVGGGGDGRAVEEDLLLWIRGLVARGTGRLLYGAENPLAVGGKDMEEAFWDFDHGLGGLLAGVWPWLTARKAYEGRERLVGAFEEWIRAGRSERDDVPDIVRERIRVAKEYGFSSEAAARSEVSFLFAGIVNTATTTFWTVLQVSARRELLAEVRQEVEHCIEESTGGNARRLSLERLKKACPTLLAVVRECLRLGSDNYSVRLVKTDTELAGGQYMLKAGSVVQIAGGVIHADTRIWGDGVAAFDHTRFFKTHQTSGNGQAAVGKERPEVQQTLSGGVHPASFRAFGGGKTLCPGRHFAINEILALVAVIVLTLEIEAADGSGRIKIPRKNDGVLPVHILEPVEPVKVTVKLREGTTRIVLV